MSRVRHLIYPFSDSMRVRGKQINKEASVSEIGIEHRDWEVRDCDDEFLLYRIYTADSDWASARFSRHIFCTWLLRGTIGTNFLPRYINNSRAHWIIRCVFACQIHYIYPIGGGRYLICSNGSTNTCAKKKKKKNKQTNELISVMNACQTNSITADNEYLYASAVFHENKNKFVISRTLCNNVTMFLCNSTRKKSQGI